MKNMKITELLSLKVYHWISTFTGLSCLQFKLKINDGGTVFMDHFSSCYGSSL